MQPKTLKRGRLKGVEVTVIGLQKKKKTESQNKLLSLAKLSLIQKRPNDPGLSVSVTSCG